MKKIAAQLSVVFLLLVFSAQADSGSGPCESDYWMMVQNSKFRSVISHTTVSKKADIALLNEMQKRAYEHYTSQMTKPLNGKRAFSVQFAQYIDRKSPKRTNGYRVRVDVSDAEKQKSFYYFDSENQLLLSYEMGDDAQDPKIKTWHCENLEAGDASEVFVE